MMRKILIVDDVSVNRQILKGILRKEYDIIEAANGEEAMAQLYRGRALISAVLLDIVMPGIDGYEVLRRIKGNPELEQIPVIMITGSEDENARVSALSLGANDFVMKPYNPDIIRHCLRNSIRLCENAALINAIRRDKLTGLNTREAFFEKCEALLLESAPGHYIMACFDIDNFKAINDQYGSKKGDEVLCHVADTFREGFEPCGGICCRVTADNFAVLYPTSFADTPQIGDIRRDACAVEGLVAPLSFSVGRYVADDLSLSPSAMFDRARLAEESIKGKYGTRVAVYSAAMRDKLLHDQEITGDMVQALKSGQFEVWFQPQYNHETGALIGAEALVRWRHPEKGMIPPGEFIPIFEQSGFVYELDKFVWDRVCALLRRWIDEGRNPLPVSVNISRYDLLQGGLIETIKGLIDKHALPASLLRLEITESAFAHSATQVVAVVQKQIDAGFTVEIDDFGSGYSSFNTLKDVPAQVIKLDMRFLESSTNSQRGGNIIESIVRMTKWLGMSVIAEGVETIEQADFLKSIGCSYIQGYLYAKPMPVGDYEALCAGAKKEERLIVLETVENLDNNAFWDPNNMDTLIFNSYVGGACIFEYYHDRMELLRVNDKYLRTFGATISFEEAFQYNPGDCMDAENRAVLMKTLRDTIETNQEMTCETRVEGLYGIERPAYIRSTVRVIARCGARYLIYCMVENTTALHAAEQERLEMTEQLRTIVNNISGGVTVTAIQGDTARLIFSSDQYYRQLGITRADYEAGTVDLFAPLHPDDRARVIERTFKASEDGQPYSVEYRVIRPDGVVRRLRSNVAIVRFPGVKEPVQIAVANDVTDQDEAARILPAALNAIIGSTPDLAFIKDESFRFVMCSPAFLKAAGLLGAKEIVGKRDEEFVSTELAKRYFDVEREILRTGKPKLDYEEVLPAPDGGKRYGLTSKYPLLDGDGNAVGIYGVTRDVTEYHVAYERLRLLTDSIHGGLATYECAPGSVRLTYHNDTFSRLMGYTREELGRLAEKNALFMVAREDIPMIFDEVRTMIEGCDSIVCDFRITTRDGACRWINLRGTVLERRGETVVVNTVFFDVTDQIETTERLRRSEEEYRLAMRHSGNVICRYSVLDATLSLEPETALAMSLPERISNVPYGPARSGAIDPETTPEYIRFYEEINRGQKEGSAVFREHFTGGWKWLNARYSTIFSDDGEPVSAVISYADITEQREKEAVYKKWQQSLEDKAPESYTLFRCNLSRDASFDTVEGSLLHVAFSEEAADFNTRTREYAAQCVAPEDRDRYVAFVNSDAMLAGFYRGRRSDSIEYREMLPGGGVRWLCLSVDLVEYPDSEDVEAYLMYENIDTEKQSALQIKAQAETDPLTGLLNRNAFTEKMSALLRARTGSGLCALMLFDLDGFKLVNDSFGHAFGDQVLMSVAEQLQTILRKDDLIGRLGGDEFLVFLSGMTSAAALGQKAQMICDTLRRAYSVEIQISVSLGIAVCPAQGTDFETLYHKADVAMYHVKAAGKDNYAFYEDKMRDEAPKTHESPSALIEERPEEPKRRMLIVEDNEINREMLVKMFKDTFIIDTAEEGNGALIRLRRYGTGISVVLLDLMMPGMDGFAVLEKMRMSPEMRAIPVIVVSGMNEREASLRTIKCGASDFVTKPIDPDLLRIRVQSAISRAENERLRAQNSGLALERAEIARYRAFLESENAALTEYDGANDTFVYDRDMGRYIAGRFDRRALWDILRMDAGVSDADIDALREAVRAAEDDPARAAREVAVTLKTPSAASHLFSVRIISHPGVLQPGNKLLLRFQDTALIK